MERHFPTESVPPILFTAPVLKVPPVVVEHVQRGSSTYCCLRGSSDHNDSGADSLPNYSADRHGATRHCDGVEDVPVVQRSLLPTVQTVQKTQVIPHVREIDKIVGVKVVWQRQVLTIQTDVPQIQCLEPLVDVPVVTQQMAEIPVVVPVVMQRPVPSVQIAQKIVEVPQIQQVDKAVNMPVVIQRQAPMTLNVQKSVEVARVIPHERLMKPGGGGSSVRERARRFEMEWGAKHMATVEGPRNVQENEQREDLESNLEQDACASVDESLGGLSLTDLRPEGADAELASREKRSHAGEMILTSGDTS